jgi:hypothetical protein
LPVAFAQAPTPAPTEQLVRIQAETTTGDVTAFFERSVTIDGVKYPAPWQSVSWNNSTKTVTVGERTLTYSEVMQLVRAIALQERAEQAQPSPQPAS